MSLINNKKEFGFLTKITHWSIFLLMATQFFIINKRAEFPKDAPEKLQYILWHKSIGVMLLYLAIFMIVWHFLGQRPLPPNSMSNAHKKFARMGHFALYAVMLLMPISGYLMSTFSGYAVSVFGWYDLPKLVAINKTYASFFFNVHEFTAYAILVLVGGHILAALYHHFGAKNNVLKRMSF